MLISCIYPACWSKCLQDSNTEHDQIASGKIWVTVVSNALKYTIPIVGGSKFHSDFALLYKSWLS